MKRAMKRTVSVVLLQDYPSLGKAGDIAVVAHPFAKNLLLPKKIAALATAGAIAQAKAAKEKQSSLDARRKASIEELARRLKGVKLVIPMKVTAKGGLYGGVKPEHIAASLAAQGLTIATSMIHIPQPIETVGDFVVQIILGPGHSVDISLNVTAQNT